MDQFYPSSPAGFDYHASALLDNQQNQHQVAPAAAWPSRHFASPGHPQQVPAGLIGSMNMTPNRTPIHNTFGSAMRGTFSSPQTAGTPFPVDGASGSGNPSSALLFAGLQNDIPPSMPITPHRTPQDHNKVFNASGRSWAQPGSAPQRVLDTPERAALAAVTAATANELHTPQLQPQGRASAPEAPVRSQLHLQPSRARSSSRRLSASPAAPPARIQGVTPVRHKAVSTPDTGYATAASATPGTGTFGAPHSGAAGGPSRCRLQQRLDALLALRAPRFALRRAGLHSNSL